MQAAPPGDEGALGLLNLAAGVWIRQDDGMGDSERPWRPGLWDRWPASIINHKHPGLWSSNQYGFVFEPSLVRLRCAYAGDGASMGQDCDGALFGCVPGCTKDRRWCQDGEETTANPGECAWRPQQLSSMAVQQDKFNTWGHNEVVVDPASVTALLPHSIAAIFYLTASSPRQQQAARAVHQALLDDQPCLIHGADSLPLLVLDLGAVASTPFSVAPGQPRSGRTGGGGDDRCRPGCICGPSPPPAIPPPPAPPAHPPGVFSFHSMYMARLPPPPPGRAQFRSHSVGEINARFRRGGPADTLENAGIIMHQWDGLESVAPEAHTKPLPATSRNS